ncbi:MAG TPA: pyridoxal phosphate-dependent aminotransferase family protein [Opitutaceae bacterium]|jgi:8-amino-7-oxononanoate synthase|nr:pyridoxal phosphate-dependent aminotransferase family protein [Opitutaceae bacterium]
MALTLLNWKKKAILERCHDDYATKMLLKYEPFYHTMEAQQGAHVRLHGQDMIMLASNDYLGLSFHPKVIEAGRAAMLQWGTSTTGARISNGSRAYHVELEAKLAAFLNREACLVSAAGYLSCMSSVAAFAQKGDVILADKNIHSCLWDGIRLSMATVERFSHNNPEDLRALIKTIPHHTPKLIVVEGVYSMEGHVVHLADIAAIADEFGAFLVVDDAHGFGVLGRQGRGTVDHLHVNDQVDVLCGSLSKSLGSTGGFVAASRKVIDFLRFNSKQTIFSAAISPSQAGCAAAALDVMQREPQHLERLWRNVRRYRAVLKGLDLDTWDSETPAIPIVLGSKELVYRFWQALLEKGVFTVMSIVPAVPPGKDLVRTAVSALHTDEDLDRIAEAMAYAVRKL